MDYKKLLDLNFDKLIDDLRLICSFNSKLGEAKPNAPYGEEINDCLQAFLTLGKNYGFDVYNCDGHAGHVEWKGESSEVVGILGHLDIIPADDFENWKANPFESKIINGELYARGSMDDKGPIVACLFAMHLLKESGYVPKKTIRVIVGCDEETAMRGVKYYLTKVPAPTIAFTPDADFPVIHAEKGVFHCEISCGKLNENILEITAGTRANVVPDYAKAVLSSKVSVSEALKDANGNFVLEHKGVCAHASIPQKGDNATWKLLKQLHELFPSEKAISFLYEKLTDYTGKKFGIDFFDKYSKLTCNIGILKTTNGELTATVDCRFPVTMTLPEFTDIFREKCPYPIKLIHCDGPLFVDENSYLVKTLLSVYNGIMNEKEKAIVIGGGTYSKCLPNCVAFGPSFIGEEETIHMPNERVNLSNYKKMTEIYTAAISELSK